MNSSGIKRGLATSAVAALAVAGIPAVANAATLATQNGAGVELRSTDSGNVSVVNDGTNTTVSLVATADSTVQFVTFSYGATVIGTVGPSANGEFQLEWTPPVGLANTNVIATATDAAGNNPGASDTEAVTISGTLSTVEIAKPAGDVGYFDQPGAGGAYGANNNNVMAVSGTTSDSADTIAVTGLGVTGGNVTVPALAGGATTQSFVGTVNVDPAALAGAANVPDQVLPVLTTDNGAGTADAQGFGLYAQQIRGISAAQSPVLPNSNTANVTVTVVDQNNNPVAGALVKRDNANGGDGSAAAGDQAEAYTNGRGQVVFTGATVGNQSYFVETTDTNGYEVGIDYRTSITVGASSPSTITFTSKDGDAFDSDEFDAGDLAINVKDSASTNLPGQTFFYKWTFTPFVTATGDTTQTSTEASVVTDANGNAVVPLPTAGQFPTPANASTLNTTGGTLTLQGYVNRGTNPGQDPADLALEPKSIKRGESDVFFDGPTTTTRQLETSQNVTGKVQLRDGTVLGGRTVNVSYASGDDSAFAATQPAGTTRLSNTAATAVTAADGTFTVAIADPNKTPDTPETGTVQAVGTATVGTGANQKNGIGADAGTDVNVFGTGVTNLTWPAADDEDDVTIQWSADAAPKFIGAGAVTEADIANALGNGFTPGRPGQFTITLSNSQGTALAGQQVTLKTDHGFFTPNASAASADPSGLTPAATPAEGGQVGSWSKLGDTITVTTDAAGQATVTVGIEKDAGFDDDGRVIANVTATSGTATNTNPITIDFRTDNTVEPLNAGSVEIVEAASNAANGIELPDARGANNVANSQQVRFNLFAKDQFGNLVADEVNINDDSLDAAVTNEGLTVVSQFSNANAVLSATATDNTSQVITATWNQASTVYTDAAAATPGFQPAYLVLNNTSKTDSADAINWYLVDFAASTFTATTDPEGPVQVGDPVIETVTVLDQKGKPVPGLNVSFIRQGPGDEQDGDPNNPITGVTNANGQAFYAFTGTEPGTARLSIVVTDGTQLKTLTDDVTIIAPDNGELQDITATLSGNNNGKKDDKLTVATDAAAQGALVELYKKTKNGKRKVDEGTLGTDGTVDFKVDDKNRKRVTRYFAKVLPTSVTNGDKTAAERVR